MEGAANLNNMSGGDGSVSFFKHVFNFDEDTKCQLMNLSQYSLTALVPVVILNKTIQSVIPEADDSKKSLEILAEVVGQVVIMFTAMVFIDRIITYIPTFSKTKYQEMNLFNIIIGFLVIVLSLQTKLGEKINILLDRLVDRWGGNDTNKSGKNKNNSQQQAQTHQPSQADILDTQHMMQSPQLGGSAMSSQQVTDFNSMYQGAPNGGGNVSNGNLIPQQMEPMAANDGFAAFSGF